MEVLIDEAFVSCIVADGTILAGFWRGDIQHLRTFASIATAHL